MEKTRKTLSKYQILEKKYLAKIDSFTKEKEVENILSSFAHADTYVLRSSRLETANYDPKWLSQIENCLPDISYIIANPRKNTKTVTDIVPIELAKKTNGESVRHLASHTQYVKEVSPKGDIIPNKILNIGSDDDYHTYENKFIATLIRQLVIFVEKRYDFMKKYAPLKERNVLMYKTRAAIEGMDVNIETKISITKAAPEKKLGETNEYMEHIEEIRKYVRYFYNSDFMKLFKNEKDIHGAILQTNIIRKNPKYHKCYRLYKYLQTYSSAGIDLKVQEEYVNLNPDEIAELHKLGLVTFLAANPFNPSPLELVKERTHKVKILKSHDDDVFIYGPLDYNDVEFVRVDKKYLEERRKNENLSKLLRYPTKEEAIYQKDIKDARMALDEDEKSLSELLKRKRKEQREFDIRQAKLDAEEEARLEEARRLEAERIAHNEATLIELERERIRLEALRDEEELAKNIAKANEEAVEVKEEPIVEVEEPPIKKKEISKPKKIITRDKVIEKAEEIKKAIEINLGERKENMEKIKDIIIENEEKFAKAISNSQNREEIESIDDIKEINETSIDETKIIESSIIEEIKGEEVKEEIKEDEAPHKIREKALPKKEVKPTEEIVSEEEEEVEEIITPLFGPEAINRKPKNKKKWKK